MKASFVCSQAVTESVSQLGQKAKNLIKIAIQSECPAYF